MTTSQDIGIVVAYANERGKQIWVRGEKRYHSKKAVVAQIIQIHLY